MAIQGSIKTARAKDRGGKRFARKGKSGKLRLGKATRTIEPGATEILKSTPKGPKKKAKAATRKIKRALKRGSTVRAKLTIKITDEAGNLLVEKRTVRVV